MCQCHNMLCFAVLCYTKGPCRLPLDLTSFITFLSQAVGPDQGGKDASKFELKYFQVFTAKNAMQNSNVTVMMPVYLINCM